VWTHEHFSTVEKVLQIGLQRVTLMALCSLEEPVTVTTVPDRTH